METVFPTSAYNVGYGLFQGSFRGCGYGWCAVSRGLHDFTGHG